MLIAGIIVGGFSIFALASSFITLGLGYDPDTSGKLFIASAGLWIVAIPLLMLSTM